jgi:phage-related protein
VASRKLTELSAEEREGFFNQLRMTENQFNYLLHCVSKKTEKSDTCLRDATQVIIKL